MPYKDPEVRAQKNREYQKRRYQKDEVYRTEQKRRTQLNRPVYRGQNRELLRQFRSNGCATCSEKTACCLVAHHLDPAEKDFNIGELRKVSPKRLAEELAKCMCLCANCHAKVHAGVLIL